MGKTTSKSIATSNHDLQLDRWLPLISLYADYEPFQNAVDALYRDLSVEDIDRITGTNYSMVLALACSDRSLQPYVANVTSIIRKFGLDRLPPLEPNQPSIGLELIHNYCVKRRMTDGLERKPSARSLVISAFGASGAEHVIEELDDIVGVEVNWNPARESKSDALKRLTSRAQTRVNQWLNSKISELSNRGVPFTESSQPAESYVLLFRKLTGFSYGRLASSQQPGPITADSERQRIQKAVIRLADRLGIDRNGW